MQGGIADAAIQIAQRRFVAFDLVPHIGEAAFQLQHIGQLCRLGEDLQKAFLLQAQGFQPGLGIGVAFGHIRHIGAAADDIAKLPGAGHGGLQPVGRDACGNAGIAGVIPGAVKAAALLAAAFDIAALLGDHLFQACQRIGVVPAFQLHPRRLDELAVSCQRCAAVFACRRLPGARHGAFGIKQRFGGLVAFAFLVIAAVAGTAGAIICGTAAAAGQHQQNGQQHPAGGQNTLFHGFPSLASFFSSTK